MPVAGICVILLAMMVAGPVHSKDIVAVQGPIPRVYKTVNGIGLIAHVFLPPPQKFRRRHSAIVLFHGGGWSAGEPAWVFGRAKMFAARGMVAVAVQYRLSDQQVVTPLEAMADAREAIRWLRRQADSLDIYPARVAAYGVSAGGHLAAAAAIFTDSSEAHDVSSLPNALILFSPAVFLEPDGWIEKLLGKRAKLSDISPAEHVRQRLPPTILFQGSEDSTTPVGGSQRFCDRMKQAGNRCELHIYQGLGHLLQPINSDPEAVAAGVKARADAVARTDSFLVSLGFLRPIQKSQK
jgi:acetyl esterase